MGCDGGTIPKRHELVKGPKKVEKVDKNAELAAKWRYCALSQEKLKRPIVACELGRLYNKDAIIEYLLDKSAERCFFVVLVVLSSVFSCRFLYLPTCGCVFSERALKEVKTEICHKCGDPFQEDNLVMLNGTKEDVEKLQKAMEERRSKAKSAKKSKKSKDTKVSKAPDSTEWMLKVSLPQEKSRIRFDRSNVLSFFFSAPGPSTSGECSKPLKAPPGPIIGSKRSIQDMKDKSETYKSLFTSHSSAKRTKDQISNWVTHTPYHF
uniref:Replication termination factor 2 n=1 Tax=Cyprinus carpio TaxID=7962 RepID=A0A8C2DHG3_CYPCA